MFWKKRATSGGRLTLHIGIHRTGTTGLQRGLAANRDRLAAQGKCYPFAGTNHQDIAWALHRGKLDGKGLGKQLEPYAGQGHIIMSGEDFCIHRELGWLAPLKAVYDVEAVVYLRRQDHWLMSWYNQHVKWPFSRRHAVMTPKEFLGCLDEFYWLDFEKMLALWEAALGREKVHVRVIEKGQVTDAIGDFLAITGIDGSKLKLEMTLQNDSRRNARYQKPAEGRDHRIPAGCRKNGRVQRQDTLHRRREAADPRPLQRLERCGRAALVRSGRTFSRRPARRQRSLRRGYAGCTRQLRRIDAACHRRAR
jgi:hypothetical protein